MGIGYVLSVNSTDPEGEARVLAYGGLRMGKGTNNKAEYLALIHGLRHALRLGVWNIAIHSDSMLVVQQIKGQWKVSGPLRHLHYEARTLMDLFRSSSIIHVPREENQRADELSHKNVIASPPLPSPFRGRSRWTRKLHGWQAAAIRVWWRSGRTRSDKLVGRVFGITPGAVFGIVEEHSYTDADLSTIPDITTYPPPVERIEIAA